MSNLKSKRGMIFSFAVMVAFVFALGACGKKNNRPIPTFNNNTSPNNNNGGGFGGGFGGGACGGAGGQPIGNPNQNNNNPFYSNLQPLFNYQGNVAPSMSLFLSYGPSNGSINGSATLNIDVASMLGYPNNQQSAPFCASTQFQGGQTYGTGYQYSHQYFVIEYLVMAGQVNVPIYGQNIPVPTQVAVFGPDCQQNSPAYVDLFTRRLTGCVVVVIGNQQAFYFRTQ